MKSISATTRITFGLTCLMASAWMLAYMMGMVPDRQSAVVRGRASVCEGLAMHCSLLATRNDRRTMQLSLEGMVQRNKEVVSAGIRRPDGELLISAGPHANRWQLPVGQQSTATQMRVPILSGKSVWGTVELRFRDEEAELNWLSAHPVLICALFAISLTYLMFFAYLRKMLQHLDPSRVIPRRVRQTLDTMAEGLLVLDSQQRILLANKAFADSLGISPDELTGKKASDLPFEMEEHRLKIEGFPWDRAMREGVPQTDDVLTMRGKDKQPCVMKVSSTPIYGDDGKQRGALTSFADVTAIEHSRVELRQMLDALSHSRDEIQRQNVELERLASRDPLTGCLNRRAFFVDLESHWSLAMRHGYPLSCIMVDLDHFKSINDTHGHQTGDMVLKKASELIRKGRRPSDLVCRYGGEEFCVVLPHTDLDAAQAVAEQIRSALEGSDFNGIPVTASLGVSARSLQAGDPQALIDQADKCLYVAKRGGRNCVVRFDQAAEEIAAFEQSGGKASKQREKPADEAADIRDSAIPFHAVTALISAPAFRDQATADHARRVADLCVTTVRRLMPVSESYYLEIAALLHDIGKIGVPDAILHKPGKLTDAEWHVMQSHERTGSEIIHSTFSSPKLTEIVRVYRAWFGGTPNRGDLPTGEDIPLAARILAIADAYDSMTRSTSYRQSLSHDEACAELQRCAIRQFDPELVERFVNSVNNLESQRLPATGHHTKPAALSLGNQVERIAQALENKDTGVVGTLAGRLQQVAEEYEATDIAKIAAQLQEAAEKDTDAKQLLQLTVELFDLCRAAQRAYLNDTVGWITPASTETATSAVRPVHHRPDPAPQIKEGLTRA